VNAPGRAVRGDVNGDGVADLVTLAHGNAYVYLGPSSGVPTAVPPAFAGTGGPPPRRLGNVTM
jgi:hypothetical protein